MVNIKKINGDRENLWNTDILDKNLTAGRYYVNGATNIPSNASDYGYLDIDYRQNNSGTFRVVKWQPYNSETVFVNMLKNSGSWSGWDSYALKNDITPIDIEQNTITPHSSINSGGVFAKRMGRLVVVSLNFNTNAGIPASDVLFSGLPRPKETTYGTLVSSDGSVMRAVYISGTAGAVMCDATVALPSGKWYGGTISYITYS